jgi:hypothetical protein
METVSADEGGAVRMAGRLLTDSQTRRWWAWKNTSACPSLYSGDKWAVTVLNENIQEFFDWAEARGLAIWAASEPAFEREPLDPDLDAGGTPFDHFLRAMRSSSRAASSPSSRAA